MQMIDSVTTFLSNQGFMPHIHCYLGRASLVWTMVLTDTVIGFSYVSIAFSLYSLVKKIKLPFHAMFLAFGLFIFACGMTHFMEIYTLWVPNYWLSAFVKLITAIASVLTAIALHRLKPVLVDFAKGAKLSEDRHRELGRQFQALQDSELKFRLLVESVKDYAIFMLDPKGYIVTWNAGARRFKGYEATEIIGQHFSVFYQNEDVIANKPKHELEVATEVGRFENEDWRVRKDGSRFWANVIITSLKNKDGKLIGFAKVTRDLTERKMADDALKQSHTELERKVEERTAELKAALAVRDDFLSIASHELKTPLTSLSMQIEMTKEKINPETNTAPPPEKLAKIFDISSKQVRRLVGLVEDLLDASRIQTGRFVFNFEMVNLSKVVKEWVSRFSEQLNKAKIEFEMVIEDGIIGQFDHLRLEQVLDNLLTNAVKYAPESHLKISLQKKGGIVRLIVADDGPGISLDQQAKLFNRFERVSTSTHVTGLGLGLFIVKEIVHGHKGFINLESAPGHGTRFIIDLPLHQKGEIKHG